MRRATWLPLLAIALAGPVAAKRPQLRFASPAAIVAAEVALSQLAQRKGRWAAYRTTADENAVLFVPQRVVARAWLKKIAEPTRKIAWQPYQVWLSCDGSLAATYGAWQRSDGSSGYFTTVWRRQPKGDYKWVVSQGEPLAEPLQAPAMIGSKVATCARAGAQPFAPPTERLPVKATATSGSGSSGGSDDGTLTWAVVLDSHCSRMLTINLLTKPDQPIEAVMQKRVAAPVGADGQPSEACPA